MLKIIGVQNYVYEMNINDENEKLIKSYMEKNKYDINEAIVELYQQNKIKVYDINLLDGEQYIDTVNEVM